MKDNKIKLSDPILSLIEDPNLIGKILREKFFNSDCKKDRN